MIESTQQTGRRNRTVKHALVTYVTWTGATHQVADAVADVLRQGGATVDVQDAGKVKRLEGYDAVVMGISVHAGKVPGDAVRFARRHARTLATLPVAQFLVCLTMSEDTEEHRTTARGYLEQVRKAMPDVTPVGTAMFGGAVLNDTEDFKRLNPILRGMAGSMVKNVPDGRDWEAIRAWAAGLRGTLNLGS
jgi:menaquinone-dependent protoporphyrinogen oxidase